MIVSIAKARNLRKQGYHLLTLDIKSAFSSVDWSVVEDILNSKVVAKNYT
jgi:hypothetical protein